MGIVNIATTSDGEVFCGKKCTEVRQRYSNLKAILQSVGTHSAKKHLKKINGKERRFKKDTNHCIAKSIVQTAKDTNRAVAIENLKGIRTNSTVNKTVRTAIGKWAFDELSNFLKYKATLAGIPVFDIGPKNTSTRIIEKLNPNSSVSVVDTKKVPILTLPRTYHLGVFINYPIVLCPVKRNIEGQAPYS
ncbi:IS200/IS605 family accessory protein TnpB-related protein [Methanolobus psychrotolerans]|nr:IS200/IS605 family accessory protein TnpB-related protein [Methanolobus psychrotolerans]